MAKLNYYLKTALGLLLLLLLSCQRRQRDFFPLVPNAVRIMQVTETKVIGQNTNTTSEVKVTEVVKGIKDVPRLGRVWVVEVPLATGKSLMNFYERKGDTVFKLIPGRDGTPERIVYLVLPLVVGKKWYDNATMREETEVIAQESVTVPAGHFANCFCLETKSKRVNFHQKIWLAPGLGIVKRVKQHSWNRGDTTWQLFRQEELVEYQITKSPK